MYFHTSAHPARQRAPLWARIRSLRHCGFSTTTPHQCNPVFPYECSGTATSISLSSILNLIIVDSPQQRRPSTILYYHTSALARPRAPLWARFLRHSRCVLSTTTPHQRKPVFEYVLRHDHVPQSGLDSFKRQCGLSITSRIITISYLHTSAFARFRAPLWARLFRHSRCLLSTTTPHQRNLVFAYECSGTVTSLAIGSSLKSQSL